MRLVRRAKPSLQDGTLHGSLRASCCDMDNSFSADVQSVLKQPLDVVKQT